MESRFKERNQLRGVHRSLRSGASSVVCDRFIPVRSAMDFDLAYYLLTEPKKVKDSSIPASPWREAYRKCLSQCLLNNRTRILAFKSKPLEPASQFLQDDYSDLVSSCMTTGTLKQQRPVCQSAVSVLDAPDILDDYYLNLLDWGSNNVLAIALENTVFLWDATDKSASELMTVQDDYGPITSIGWSSDGRTIAVGLNSSVVQLWDATSNRLLRTLRGVHHSRVGSLAWSNHCLATGGMDGLVVNNDVRIRNHCIQTYKGHSLDVCGLKWSESGRCLASGGNDNLLHIWDVSMVSRSRPPSQNQWLHKLTDHTGAVKALAWCPFQSSLLASGGGSADKCIKFWNAQTGTCLKSVDTGSRVSSLLWSKDEKKLLSSHGLAENQLTLWKYSSMTKIVELRGHQSPILFTTHSPDGCLVASAAADETLMFWNVFGNPNVPKCASKTESTEPFVDHCFIR